MRRDLRKDSRRLMSHTCWIVTGAKSQPQQCQLSDASDSGGKIAVPDAEKVPDKFILLLTENGAAARKCKVVWRKDREVGVRFLGKALWTPEPPPEAVPIDA